MQTLEATNTVTGELATIQIESEPCSFTVDGHTFTSGGAYVTPEDALVYVGEYRSSWFEIQGKRYCGRYVLTNWGSEIIGVAERTGKWTMRQWRVDANGFSYDCADVRMESYVAMINGVRYVGRKSADYDALRLRRAKVQPRNQIA